MKLAKTLATAAVITSLTATIAFAAPDHTPSSLTTQQQKTDTVEKEFKGQQDPIKALESKKEKIQAKLKDGKITKEKADRITAKIDAKIKEIQEFNRLTLQQKKDKLIRDFKAFANKRVKDGKLTQDEADKLIKSYTDKVNQWDGNGYPKFGKRGFGGKCGHDKSEKNK